MPTLDDNKVLGASDLDAADMERAVDLTVSDPLELVQELVTSRPAGVWASRVSALLLYLMHKANGDDSVRVGVADDFATQSNDVLLRVVSGALLVRNTGDGAYAAIRPSQVTMGTGGAAIYSDAGDPEGSQAAVVGSLYMRTDGGTGTTLYVKESGTGNTGWAAV